MPIRITIIEDSRETISRLLEHLSYVESAQVQPISVAPFFSDEIEEAIAKFNPNLIILDLRLLRDEGSGYRVLRQLKTSKKVGHLPVIVCSRFIGRDENDINRRKAISLGAASALPKYPFPKAEEFLRYARVVEHEG